MRAAVYGRQSSNKAKSIDEQLKAGHLLIDDEGWQHAGDYSDGRSASRYATKKRDDWARLLDDVKAANLDVLILWESSRGDRTLSSWSAFLEDCRDSNVKIYVIKDERLYDLRKARDWKTLAEDGVTSAYESELLSARTRRGHAGAAASGLPPGGPVPYGYRRLYNPETGRREGWIPDETKAAHVRDLFRQIGRGVPVMRVAAELGLDRNSVLRIARSPVYLGIRTHAGRQHQGTWEPLVTPEMFADAQAVIGDPARRITRPGKQKHLLTYLAVCDVCDAWIEQAVGYYRCSKKRCVSAPLVDVDAALTEVMVARLGKPDSIRAMAETDETEVSRHEAEAARLRSSINEWEDIAKQGKDSPARIAGIIRSLEEQAEAAEKSARAARLVHLPAGLRVLLDSPQVGVRQWWEGQTMLGRRQTISALAQVRIAKGMPGRLPRIRREERALRRLFPSRWVGGEVTWGELLVLPGEGGAVGGVDGGGVVGCGDDDDGHPFG